MAAEGCLGSAQNPFLTAPPDGKEFRDALSGRQPLFNLRSRYEGISGWSGCALQSPAPSMQSHAETRHRREGGWTARSGAPPAALQPVEQVRDRVDRRVRAPGGRHVFERDV